MGPSLVIEPGTVLINEDVLDRMVYTGKGWQRLHRRKIHHALQTYSGGFIWPLDPRPDEIYPEDIAHGLACENRYGNQSPYPYSVGWHSIALSHVVPEHLQKFALIHDAPEAYIKDLPRVIRSQEPFKTEYEEIDNRFLNVICERFGVKNRMTELREYDVRMSHSEMIVWAETNPVFLAKMKALNIDLTPAYNEEWLEWVRSCPRHDHWEKVEVLWLQRYEELFNANSKVSNRG